MNVHGRPKAVLLGIMSRHPVAGVVWQTIHYLVGLQRMGYDAYYVEDGGHQPSAMLARADDADRSLAAARFIAGVMRRFGMNDRWAFHALQSDGRCYGLSERELAELYDGAALVVNLHGATRPRPEHYRTGRLVYVETDPVLLQIELHAGRRETIEFLEPHCAFFTFGENYARPGCGLPVSERFAFLPTRQPVVTEYWQPTFADPAETFTTVGNWEQRFREVQFGGELYHWSKHFEFLKFVDLPARVGRQFELALSRLDDDARRMLEGHGWRLRDALSFSVDADAYREYVQRSRGEFTVAKDQNIRLRTGWFSDRSATYLAAGRPVITQETGFSEVLPTGEGLFGFATMEELVAAVGSVNAEYQRHSRGARAVARECFGYDVVLRELLSAVGAPLPRRGPPAPAAPPFPLGLVLEPLSRAPTTLPDETVRRVTSAPMPPLLARDPEATRGYKRASVVVVAHDGLVFTRLCLGSLIANTDYPAYEVVVVDNGSTDGTPEYLLDLVAQHPHVRVVLNGRNLGFATANNQGLALAGGDVLVLLNNDTIVPPGWLGGLVRHLGDPTIGAVGPVTNRIGNEAQIETTYRTYGEMLGLARARAGRRDGELFDARTLTMFCLALRRDVFEKVGRLDERFEVGLLEDDDYARRLRAAGYRLVCAEGVFVHHFGQASFGRLIPTGEYGRLLESNKRRFEEKWGEPWQPYERRPGEQYQAIVAGVRAAVASVVPEGATVAVVSRGDDALVDLPGRRGWHFPRAPEGGGYAGHYPADGAAAVAHLEALRAEGAGFLVLPASASWWLEHYPELRRRLEEPGRTVHRDDDCTIYALGEWVPERVEHAQPVPGVAGDG